VLYIYGDMCTYMMICNLDLRTVKNVSDNNSRGNPNTHFVSTICPLSVFPKMKPFM